MLGVHILFSILDDLAHNNVEYLILEEFLEVLHYQLQAFANLSLSIKFEFEIWDT